MKRGRPEIEMVDLNPKRLQEALDYRGRSLRSLNLDPILNASEKTIRRAKKTGKINPDILDRLGKCLDVDPDFLSGDYDKWAAFYSSTREEEESIKSQFIVQDYPYVHYQRKSIAPGQIINDILIEHGIPISEFNKLSQNERAHFFIEINRAVSGVIWKYFKPHRPSIYNYTIPMPPEDEITQE